jgi:hypothetical protein
LIRFQKRRDPKNVEIERRAAEHAAAGYPLPEHDIAMDAEALIEAAKLAKQKELASEE